MESLGSDPFPVGEDLLRLERAERRFHREVNGVDYLSWRDLVRRVRPDRRYRVTLFEMPRTLTGEEVLAPAHETLVERSCTYVDTILQVGPEYEVPVGDLWETHTDPETGRTLVTRGQDDYWRINFLIGADDEEVDDAWMAGILEPVGLSVASIAAEVIAKRCEETGVTDPEAVTETLWAVRRAVAKALTDEDEQRTLRQLLIIARARAEETFDRGYGLVRMRRAGVDLDRHPEWMSLQALFDAGFRPPTHQEAADIIIGIFGEEDARRG